MANTYTWKIDAMDRYPTQNSLTGVVHTVHWRMSAISDQTGQDGNPYVTSTFGDYRLAEPDTGSYTEYTGLTQAVVEGWLENGLDTEQIKSQLDDQINQQITPQNLTESPPWENSQEGSIYNTGEE